MYYYIYIIYTLAVRKIKRMIFIWHGDFLHRFHHHSDNEYVNNKNQHVGVCNTRPMNF